MRGIPQNGWRLFSFKLRLTFSPNTFKHHFSKIAVITVSLPLCIIFQLQQRAGSLFLSQAF